jgi:hypothetical protein
MAAAHFYRTNITNTITLRDERGRVEQERGSREKGRGMERGDGEEVLGIRMERRKTEMGKGNEEEEEWVGRGVKGVKDWGRNRKRGK